MWWTIKELASYLNIKEKTLYSFVNRGLIPYFRVEKLIRFKKDDIDQWMESKKAKSFEKQFSKITKSIYNAIEGRPSRLGKGVDDAL